MKRIKKDAHRYSSKLWDRLYFEQSGWTTATEEREEKNHTVDKWCSEEQNERRSIGLNWKNKEYPINASVFFCVSVAREQRKQKTKTSLLAVLYALHVSLSLAVALIYSNNILCWLCIRNYVFHLCSLYFHRFFCFAKPLEFILRFSTSFRS